MFSEYASRFLAQSQSRLSNLGQPDGDHPSRPNEWASSRPGRSQRDAARANQPSRNILSRGYGGNPYQQNGTGSRFGHLGFASRISAAQEAPLFHSTLDEFREEDDEEEREREAADLFALQRSRRVAAASKLAESAESGASHASMGESATAAEYPYPSHALARGIKSSWNGARSTHQHRRLSHDALTEDELHPPSSPDDDDAASHGPDGKGKMVDIGLESQEDGDGDPPESLLGGEAPADPSTPPFQSFKPASEREPFISKRSSVDSDPDSPRRRYYNETEAGQARNRSVEGELFKHDPFFAWIFLISLAGMMSTFILVWLHTSPRKSPVGDTIYTTLQKSFDMLAVDTIVSVFVSLIWLAALRSFVRPLVSVILVAVPVIMLSFSLYPFVSSFQGRTQGVSVQDSVMRWASLVPAGACVLWLWLVVKGRRAIQQAIEMLQFSSRILAQNPGLLAVGFGCLGLIVLWTWAWLAMFTRVFMGGYFSKSLVRFVIQLSSWWLGAAFILMYLWTLAVINAVHRATTAATVSQWYFHRNAGPVTSSRDIHLPVDTAGAPAEGASALPTATGGHGPGQPGGLLGADADDGADEPADGDVLGHPLAEPGDVGSGAGPDGRGISDDGDDDADAPSATGSRRGGQRAAPLPAGEAAPGGDALRHGDRAGLRRMGHDGQAAADPAPGRDGGARVGRRMERGQGRFCLEAAYLFGEGRPGEGGYV
ncbi:hypothetical protein XA68_15543 [Ophiocordyceps unilateralis]|uniref:Protein PNS1 n=1 Tax=Ophiocordyceps unilateralis TaxID=268505 RepID=A0A2A9PLT0_OPHUN|nr:hypothetical protein XA68_15543 [Ophiocordyceps unilateralis]